LVTTGITGAAAAAGTQNRENTAESKSGMGSDLFLQLLVAQMRYQNPFSGEQDTGQMIHPDGLVYPAGAGYQGAAGFGEPGLRCRPVRGAEPA